MLSPDSFLRQIPHALEPRARLILESAGWAIDAIQLSFADLETVAQAVPIDTRSDELDRRLFVHCWSIVDQCHMLRSLLQRLPPPQHEELNNFISRTETYTLIRNSMDHLAAMLGNLVGSKTVRAPLFGALSWIRVQPEDLVNGKVTKYASCSVSTGMVLGKDVSWTAFNPKDAENITGPVCNFLFEVLDYSADLSGLIRDVRGLLQHFEEVARPRVETNIRDGATSRGLDPDEVLKLRGGGGLKVAMLIRRTDDGHPQ